MKFEEAAEKVKTLSKCSDEDKLQLYGLYKQATIGDVNTQKPGLIHVEGRQKWEAWNSKKGMSSEDAKTKYADLAEKLLTADGK